MRKFFFVLSHIYVFLLPALCLSLLSCEPDKNEDVDSEYTTSEIAVTGLVDVYGCTYAIINGYANLSLLPSSNSNIVVGVELVEVDENESQSPRKKTTASLVGNIFTVSFRGLSPGTRYKYRSFVSYGGIVHYGIQYRTFTTKDMVCLTNASHVSDITRTSAVLNTSVRTEGVDMADEVYVGIAWATSKSSICSNGDFASRKIPVQDIENDVFTVFLKDLSEGVTYYYASFTEVGGVLMFSSVKEFTTNELVNLVSEVEVSDITRTSAVVQASVRAEDVDAIDDISVGVAWATSESAICPKGKFANYKISVQDIENEEFSVFLADLLEGTTYYYASFTEMGGVQIFSSVKSFSTKAFVDKAGDAIDLGLSVKWSSWNVGAESPEEFGGYYAWGETEEKAHYDWSTYKWCNGSYDSMTKYCFDSCFGTVDNKNNLSPEDDVAHVKWGERWRMPTIDEIDELCNKCTWVWTSLNGVNGYLITGPNGNGIFLPAAGHRDGKNVNGCGSYGSYWSATVVENCSYIACFLYFRGGEYDWNDNNRYYGRTIRPVRD